MNNFLLFAGDTYYPVGGWHDLKGNFPTIDAGKEFLLQSKERYDWAHIVELGNQRIVWRRP